MDISFKKNQLLEAIQILQPVLKKDRELTRHLPLPGQEEHAREEGGRTEV